MPNRIVQENYLMQDHRACDGVLKEFKVYTCKHCQRQIVHNPERQRVRHYCRKCDSYICDNCEVTRVASGYACKTFAQVIEEYLESVTKPKTGILLP